MFYFSLLVFLCAVFALFWFLFIDRQWMINTDARSNFDRAMQDAPHDLEAHAHLIRACGGDLKCVEKLIHFELANGAASRATAQREALARFMRKGVVTTQAESSLLKNGNLTRNPADRVLMLDIDGVLHPAQSGTLRYKPLLEDWLREHTNIDVVISSNWKDSHTFAQLTALFSPDIRDRIIGTTPTLDDAYREDEILALVQKYKIDLWVALDDQPQGFPRTASSHLIQTEYFDGLTPGHLVLVAQALRL